MISTKHRFHGYGSLRHVYGRGDVARGPYFLVRILANPKRSSYRAAVVVSRKVNKSAVARNRLRRQLYEALRLMEGDISKPVDIVINVHSDELAQLTPVKLRRQLKAQLKKAGAISATTSTK